LAALFVGSAVLRAVVTIQLSHLATFHSLVEDAAEFQSWALRLAAGAWVPDQPFYLAPLYPYFLAALYALFGSSLEVARMAQILLGSASVLILAAVAWNLGGRRCGYLGGVIAAAYAPFLFYAPLLLKPTLLIFVESLFVLSALVAAKRSRPILFAVSGLCLGLTVHLRGNMLALVPFALLWVLLATGRRRAALGSRAAAAAALLLGLGVALLPVALLNYQASGELILTSSQSGLNFFIGNSRDASGLYQPLGPGRQNPKQEQEDAHRLAAGIESARSGIAVSPGQLSRKRVSEILWQE
jgi:4-amino-4-deoxy-L-arabinose transferase-like glycosyltransferase